jgi:hypothetical protein
MKIEGLFLRVGAHLLLQSNFSECLGAPLQRLLAGSVERDLHQGKHQNLGVFVTLR